MDGINPHFTVTIFLSFLLLVLSQTSTKATSICSAPILVEFTENNNIGDVVVTITAEPDVTIVLEPPPANQYNPFRLDGHQLIAEEVLDYETTPNHIAKVICTAPDGSTISLTIIVKLINVNDHRPVFEQDIYQVNVNEMSPVNTIVGRFPATDLDGGLLYYRLTAESNAFKLSSPTNPEILVQIPLEFDRIKDLEMTLHAQDTPLSPPSSEVSFTASTTIRVTIVDVNNRPPWFQPCTKYEIGGALMCQNSGYIGSVFLNETEPDVLPLEPGPLHAIDGDSGINAAITYSIMSGNDDLLFLINAGTGNITMQKAASALKTITLTVLAAETMNIYQFATTTVTITVKSKSLHPPRFQKSLYEGVVTGVGVKATDAKNKDEPLLIVATDDDYDETGGLNPYITYTIDGSSDFSIVNNYLFMTKEVPDSTLTLRVVAIDTTNHQSATAQLSVQVTVGPTTTVPPSTTDSMATTAIGESTTNSKTTADIGSTSGPSTSTDSSVSTTITSLTSESIITTTNSITPTDSSVSTITPSLTSLTSEGSISSASTTHPLTGPTTTRDPLITTDSTAPTSTGESTTEPGKSTEINDSTPFPSITSDTMTTANSSISTEGGVSTITPSLPSEGSISTASTAHPHTEIIPSGGYGTADMAALGATLGVLLFICMAVIGVLLFRMQRGKEDWKKIYETSMFRSSLGQGSGGQKDVIQYTNDAFQHDDDGVSNGSGGPERGGVTVGGEPRKAGGDILLYGAIAKSSAPLHALLRDDTSQAGSDTADSEKEVKPILTKERRVDEGYKSVWFKEDIDPDAKEEVVIIPDSTENDSEEEDEDQQSSSREEDEEDGLQIKTPRVVFNDADLDSGLGVKMDDPAEDSDNEVNISL